VLYVILTGLVLSACGAPPAYIHNADEFNRRAATFAKAPENIDSVTVCYNKFGTRPEIIAKMAQAECGKFNKEAEFSHQSFQICPLVTPVAAVYDCVGKESRRNYLN